MTTKKMVNLASLPLQKVIPRSSLTRRFDSLVFSPSRDLALFLFLGSVLSKWSNGLFLWRPSAAFLDSLEGIVVQPLNFKANTGAACERAHLHIKSIRQERCDLVNSAQIGAAVRIGWASRSPLSSPPPSCCPLYSKHSSTTPLSPFSSPPPMLSLMRTNLQLLGREWKDS